MTDTLVYFAIISIAFCFGLVWLARRAEQNDLSQRTAMDLALAVMIGGFFGSRLLHIIYEAPDLYIAHPAQVYRVWEGGFVWYGGAILGALSATLMMKLKREPVGKWLDVSAPVVAASYALGRMACWFEGCCFGRFYEVAGINFQFPAQLFLVVWEASVAMYLLRRENRVSEASSPGSLFALYLILHGIGRIVMEIFRDDDRGPALGPFTISIIISLALIGIGLAWRKRLRSKVLVAIILLCSVSAFGETKKPAAKASPTPAPVTLQKRVLETASALKSAKTNDERIELLASLEKTVEADADKSTVEGVRYSVALKPIFENRRDLHEKTICAKTRTDILQRFSSGQGDSSKVPHFVKDALEVLSSACQDSSLKRNGNQ